MKAVPTASQAAANPASVQPSVSQNSPVSNPTTATVPDVLGLTLSAATSALEARGFHNIPWLDGCYGSADIGDVVQEVPGGGAQIALTAPVRLNLQANNCDTVPAVLGLDQSAAVSTLEQAGFDHNNIYWIYECLGSSHINDVVTQSPAAGTSYGNTEQVTIKLQADNC
jgi:beta-lactam-binding protein with PASTA domain